MTRDEWNQLTADEQWTLYCALSTDWVTLANDWADSHKAPPLRWLIPGQPSATATSGNAVTVNPDYRGDPAEDR